ncbi:hypothetical protein JHK85_023086 [Glycine max]|nr:hypothetical protein JHK85_023086 [Glycine max]KAG5026703.1 hypothetical protein JHK86_022617 [Glycine max]
MDKFGRIAFQIRNLNPKVALNSMLLALRHGKFAHSLCKKTPSSMDELHERSKDYIQIEEMSRFRNECHKREGSTKTDSHNLDKRHKPDKRQPLPKGPKYYTPLTANRTTILEEAFNAEVPIKLPQLLPPRSGLDRTKYCKYHHNYDHNTKDYWALKEKIE